MKLNLFNNYSISSSDFYLLGQKRNLSKSNSDSSIDEKDNNKKIEIYYINKIKEIFPKFEQEFSKIKEKDIKNIKNNDNNFIEFIKNEMINIGLLNENGEDDINDELLLNKDKFKIKREQLNDDSYFETISKKDIINNSKSRKSKMKKFNEIKNKKNMFYLSSLKDFQKKSIISIENKESLLLCSYSGKTEIIKYIISISIMEKKKIIYITPKKDIINKIFVEFNNIYNNNIGLINEDLIINKNAYCILMNNKALRKILYEGDKLIEEISWIIFEDIEYIFNKKKSNIIEEILILLPNKIKYIFLSNPFPNSREFGQWICDIKNQRFNIICSYIKQISIKYYLYPIMYSNSKLFYILYFENKNEDEFNDINFINAFSLLKKGYKFNEKYSNIFILQLEKIIFGLNNEKYLPIIIICFSEIEVEEYSYKILSGLIDNNICYATEEEKQKIQNIFYSYIKNISEENKNLEQISKLLYYLKNGIGIYHNGMIPILKEIVEILFENELIKIIFSTEKINLSSKTIIFTSIIKYDEENKRMLNQNEYNKIINIIGRPKKDIEGNIVIMINEEVDREKLKKLIKGENGPLSSSFKISYNQISYLIKKGFNLDLISKNSFKEYQINKELKLIQNKLSILYKVYLDYFESNNEKYSFLKELYKKKIKLFNIKTKLNKKLFNIKYIKEFLVPGRIINIKYFGYGIITGINGKDISYQNGEKYNKNINYIINCNTNQIGNEIIYNEIKIEDIFKSIRDNSISNNNNIENIINVLVPIKNIFESDDYTNKFGNNLNMFSKIISIPLSMINNIYKLKIKIEKIKEIKILNEYIQRLKMLIKILNNNLPEINIIEKNNIQDEEIMQLSNEFIYLKKEYENYKLKYYERFLGQNSKNNNNINYNDNDINIILEKEFNLFQKINDIEKEMNYYIIKSKRYKSNNEINNMICVMKKLCYLNEDNTLTKKGFLLSYISPFLDDILLVELIYNNFFKNLNEDQFIATLYYCLSKKKIIQKNLNNNNKSININYNYKSIYNFEEIFINIIKEEKKISEIYDEYEINNKADKKMYIYIDIIIKWIKNSTFKELLSINESLFEGKIIKIIRNFEKFIIYLASCNYIEDKNFESKINTILKKIKRRIIPFNGSLYIKKN